MSQEERNSKRTFIAVIIVAALLTVTVISIYSMSVQKEQIKQTEETARETQKKNTRTFNFGFGKKDK
jgi:uncharacterized membrane protein (DUF106 family)